MTEPENVMRWIELGLQGITATQVPAGNLRSNFTERTATRAARSPLVERKNAYVEIQLAKMLK